MTTNKKKIKIMKKLNHLTLFENFEREREYNMFKGIDVSDLYSFDFIWSNMPFISDYTSYSGGYGTKDKGHDVCEAIIQVLEEHNIDKYEFGKLLEKNFESTEYHDGLKLWEMKNILVYDSRGQLPEDDMAYSINLEGEGVVVFFEILENIEEYM